jgi:hypothetical protein
VTLSKKKISASIESGLKAAICRGAEKNEISKKAEEKMKAKIIGSGEIGCQPGENNVKARKSRSSGVSKRKLAAKSEMAKAY